MIAATEPLLSNATAVTTLATTCLAVVGAVLGTCWKVVRWVNRQEKRYAAVDVLVTDWDDRGLTPRGAVDEAAKYRDLVDVHTAAISSHATRLETHDERFEATDMKLDHISARVDEIAVSIRRERA